MYAESPRVTAIHKADFIMASNPVFLDTETTGLDGSAEVCSISVINFDGAVLIDTLIKPVLPIPESATAIHGITNEMVKDAPTIIDILQELTDILATRKIVIYNLDFDIRVLRQSVRHYLPDFVFEFGGYCAMKLYAQFYGEWNDYRKSFVWQKLGNAARQCRIAIPENLHNSAVDAELTRQIVMAMATA